MWLIPTDLDADVRRALSEGFSGESQGIKTLGSVADVAFDSPNK